MAKLIKFGEFESGRSGSLKETDKDEKAPWLIDHGQREILGVEWRAAGPRGDVGFVAVKNVKTNYWTCYLGIVTKGNYDKNDVEDIALYGAMQPEYESSAYFSQFKDLKYKSE